MIKVSRQVDSVIEVANIHCQNENALFELKDCARNVTDSVIQLLNSVKESNEQIVYLHSSNSNNNLNNSSNSSHIQRQNESIEKIFITTDNLFCSIGDASEIIRQAKILAQATTELVNSLKQEAHLQQTNDQQRKLLLAAKLLAEATSKMVEAAKGCAANPQDLELQNNLRKAAQDLKNATQAATGDNLQHKLIKRLELCAKQAASCATQSIAAIQVCTLYSNNYSPTISNSETSKDTEQQRLHQNNQTHNQLIQLCKQVADNVPKVVQGGLQY
jgi:talin